MEEVEKLGFEELAELMEASKTPTEVTDGE
jgi:hypothetical protein